MASRTPQVKHEIQATRKTGLIDATITAISQNGLSNVTLAKIAGLAGLTAGSINFHFSSKEELLLATLTRVSEEFSEAIEAAIAGAGDEPHRILDAIVGVSLDPKLSEARRVSVWYAFLSEAHARVDYQRLCGDRDNAYFAAVLNQCGRIIDERGSGASHLNAEAIAYGLTGLIEQLWQEILFSEESYDRNSAKEKCRAYLASVFPWCFSGNAAGAALDKASPLAPLEEDALIYTLPAWTYADDEFFALEQEQIFLPSWQLVCHVSDIREAGQYVTFEMLGERAVVIRDQEGQVNAFHNVCRHRAHAVVEGHEGRCGGFLRCPYHGWTYHLDGSNRAISASHGFTALDKSQWGLKSIECEVFLGFVFIRFTGDGPSVAERFAPYAEEFAKYLPEQLIRTRDWPGEESGFWEEAVDIDWKNGVENYVEDYHFPIGHRGLFSLMETQYDREGNDSGIIRLSHRMREAPLKNWSAERYSTILPDYRHLPVGLRRRWTYYALFPNTFFDIFPDKMDFFQMIPTAPGKVLLRGRSYALKDSSREGRAARYLSDRINMRVQDEDNVLTESVQRGLGSSGYEVGILSDKESMVKYFQDWVRERIPASLLLRAPAKGTVANHNRILAEDRG